MFDWIFENWGLLCIWLGILANAAGLIYSVCKLLRRRHDGAENQLQGP